ncbi:PAS domain-containing hybrid sensor histidine kinase/response regulator [Nitratireductor pacificus]|uniref:Sensory/regulatory protein RpfC n=1 Tax=Nitratireductor pacificus pht-3B TaxID=391937 RepID=K2MND2_9HYPH|nr:response regulator [Nitratireductor pacificus]EKF18797.1 PAS sensor protein [Nitratireductor pacificus pht-3B]
MRPSTDDDTKKLQGAGLGRELSGTELSELVRSAADWLWESDANHRLSWVSPGFGQASGLDNSRLIGKARVIPGRGAQSEAGDLEEHERLLAAHEPFHDIVHEIAEANPACRWISISGSPRFSDDGVFLGYRGTGRNITPLMRMLRRPLAAALERATLAEAMLDELPNPVFAKDSDLRLVLVNRACAGMLGVRAEHVLGKTAADFSPAPLAARFEESDRQVLETGVDYETEEDFEQPGIGRHRVVRKHRVEADGGRGYVVGTIFDITGLKQREQAADDARKHLVDVLESLPAGVVIYDRDDGYVLANRKMQASLPDLVHTMKPGCSLRDTIEAAHQSGYFRESGFPEIDALYDRDPEAWVDAYLQTYHIKHRVFERRIPDGRWFKAIDTRTEEGLFVGVRVDITELKERERELRAARETAVLADRAKSEFLANMSHEIRTPMNGVLGMAELLTKTELTAKQKTFADIILKSGNALLTIINDILDFSKIDAGHIVLDEAPFHLAEAIEDVATLMSSRAKEKDLELIVRVDPGIAHAVVGDAGRIRQILTNLVGNAVKFTEKGHVLVNVGGAGIEDGRQTLQFSVTDTGIGIPKGKLDQVFDKFSQVDASSTRRHEGTGLGLAITSRLVELMGGRIGVDSVEGRGSTFWFTATFPVAEAPERQPIAPRDVSGARVLVVDDNATNRMILSEQMAHWGFDACAARDVPEGLKVLRAAADLNLPVDCLVVDYQMPIMNGIDMVQAMQRQPALAGIPVVLLTSVDQSLASLGARSPAIAAQLIKPTRSAALLEAIVAAIQGHRADDEADAEASEPPEVRSAEQEQSQAHEADRGDPEAAEGGIDILVAEDNEVNQLVFRQILAETGLRFEIVDNGRRAVAAYSRLQPAMILMDVSMPEMNGLEATKEIRRAEDGQARRVPVIGVTAHALKGDRERCLEAGMDDYLSKPISPRALLDKINLWIGPKVAGMPKSSRRTL